MGMNYERVLRAGRVFRKCQLKSKAELGVFEKLRVLLFYERAASAYFEDSGYEVVFFHSRHYCISIITLSVFLKASILLQVLTTDSRIRINKLE